MMIMSLSSCNDWLDVSPKEDIKAEDFYVNENGFRDVLTGVYSLMSNSSTYGTQLSFGYVDVLAQYYNRILNTNHIYFETKNYEYNEQSNEAQIAAIWTSQYKAIVNLNSMLLFIDDAQSVFSSDDAYRLIKGEATALRALLHFDLLRLFGPNPVTSMDQKAIPYVKTYTNVAQPQLTGSEIIDLVLNDLDEARNLMRDIDLFGPNSDLVDSELEALKNRLIHMNYWAATALKARVHLYNNDKAKALETAQELIGQPNDGPVAPFAFSPNDRGVFETELIFALERLDRTIQMDPYFGEGATASGSGVSNSILDNSISSINTLYEAVNPIDNDYRISWYKRVDNTYMILQKFRTDIEIPMLRISEMYYIAAECSPDEEQGLAYLNAIRANRGLAPLADVNLEKEIQREYKKEFVGEGQMFFYFKRLNLDKLGVHNTISSVDDAIYRLPIPVKEIEYGNIEN